MNNLFIFSPKGDNILTAISVARHCGMIEERDRLVVVNAQPPEGDKPASIRWEEDVQKQESTDYDVADSSTQVSGLASFHLVSHSEFYIFI